MASKDSARVKEQVFRLYGERALRDRAFFSLGRRDCRERWRSARVTARTFERAARVSAAGEGEVRSTARPLDDARGPHPITRDDWDDEASGTTRCAEISRDATRRRTTTTTTTTTTVKWRRTKRKRKKSSILQPRRIAHASLASSTAASARRARARAPRAG